MSDRMLNTACWPQSCRVAALVLALLTMLSQQGWSEADVTVMHTAAGKEIQLVRIPAGTGTVGRDPVKFERLLVPLVFQESAHRLDETPARQVAFEKPYLLARCRTTVAEFCEFLNANPGRDHSWMDRQEAPPASASPESVAPELNGLHTVLSTLFLTKVDHVKFSRNPEGKFVPDEGYERCAVVVPWQEANAYCQWLSQTTDKPVRLPTHDEWEYAARGPEGIKTLQRSGAGQFHEAEGEPTQPVDAFPENRTRNGLCRMLSHTGDWTSDICANDTIPSTRTIAPEEIPESERSYVVKRCPHDFFERDCTGALSGIRVLVELP